MEKNSEDFSDAYVVSLLFQLINSARGTDDLSLVSLCDREMRQEELTYDRNAKGKVLVSFLLKDFFGFAEHQQKAGHGTGYSLASSNNSRAAVLNKAVPVANAKKVKNNFHCYVPHYAPSNSQEAIISKHFLSKTPTELRRLGISVFMKNV